MLSPKHQFPGLPIRNSEPRISFATTSGRCEPARCWGSSGCSNWRTRQGVTHCTHASGAKLINRLLPISAAFATGKLIYLLIIKGIPQRLEYFRIGFLLNAISTMGCRYVLFEETCD